MLPAASVAIPLTVIVPLSRVSKSETLSSTGTAVLPLPVTIFVTVFASLVKVTIMSVPASAITVTTPVAAVASAAVASSAIPIPSSSVGASGGEVSSVKEMFAVGEVFPEASVATALTAIVPSPNATRLSKLSRTGTGTLPFPVTILLIALGPLEKVTTMELPDSAATVTIPVIAVASEVVAPLPRPVPRARIGTNGTLVSSLKEVVPAGEVLPAASVATALVAIVPSPSVTRSAVVSTTGTDVLPLPVTVLLTVLFPLAKLTTMVLPASAITVTTPVAAVAS